MKKLKVISFFVLVILSYIAYLVSDAGFFRKIENIKFGTCQAIRNISGPEDMARIPGEDLVIISADKRDDQTPGDLYLYDLNLGSIVSLWSGLKLDFSFHPHGLDIISAQGETFIYVINHRNQNLTTIEVFKWNKSRGLKFMKTIDQSLLQSANDLILESPESFYVTSDFGTVSHFQKTLEQYSYIKSGYLSHFKDGLPPAKVADHIFFANGVAISSDHKQLLVAAMLEKKIYVYNSENNLLSKNSSIEIAGAPDNISLKGERLLVAAHPNLLALKRMSGNRRHRAPSKIISIENWSSANPIQNVIYENAGDEISAASIAIEINENRILIGSVFDDHILDCKKR